MATPSTLTINTDGLTSDFQSTINIGAWGVVTVDITKTLTILIDSGGDNERTRTVIVEANTVTKTVGNTVATVTFNLDHTVIYLGESVEIVTAEGGILDDTTNSSAVIVATTTVTNNSTVPVPVGITFATGINSWGVVASATQIPKFVKGKRKNSVILTKRGWEQRLAGSNPNKGLMEVIVAGRFGEVGSNEVPYFFEEFNPLSREIAGISGALIDPYIIEICDPNKILGGDSISIGSTSGMPSGLNIIKILPDLPLEIFEISGVPTSSESGLMVIIFNDTAGGSVSAGITYTISSS